MAPLAYAQMQILTQAIEAVQGFDDARLSAYARDSTFETVMGAVRFGVNGEWQKPRVLQVQFQDIEGDGIGQFGNGSRQVVVSPPAFAAGTLRFPYA
jgi:branched-chain amino acid transport system substrate-binding protein